MPKLATPLTDIQPRNAKPKEKPYKLSDGGGLYLLVNTDGAKYWRMDYRYAGTRKTLAFGRYPQTSLAQAREKRAAARRLLDDGTDPSLTRRIEKRQKAIESANTFEAIAREWHRHKADSWQPRTATNVLYRLEKDVFPLIGKYPIKELKVPIILDMLRQIERRGAVEMARRQAQVCGQIFRYAVATGVAEYDPVPSLRGALRPTPRGHHAAITPDELPEFLRILAKNEVHMSPPTRILTRLMLLVFVRTSELTETPWSEIDLDHEEWVIPWQRMKMGKRKINPRKVDHHVFLPRQGWALLRELHAATGGGKYLFPNRNDHERPASNWGILAALKRMGYNGRMTGHGFRSLAMGVIKERLGYRHEVVDRQLSHQSGDTYGEAYDRAEFKDERKKMMQQYADYLDAAVSDQAAISGRQANITTYSVVRK